MDIILSSLGGMIILNCAGYILFGLDKRRAELGEWRISEGTLLRIALLGGWLGCYTGRHVFRHKTRKQPFGNHLFTVTTINVMLVGALIGWSA